MKDVVIKLWPSRRWAVVRGWVNKRRGGQLALCANGASEFFPGLNPRKPVLVRVSNEPKPGYLEFRLSKYGTLGTHIYARPAGPGECQYLCGGLQQAAEEFKILPDDTNRHVSVHVLIENL